MYTFGMSDNCVTKTKRSVATNMGRKDYILYPFHEGRAWRDDQVLTC